MNRIIDFPGKRLRSARREDRRAVDHPVNEQRVPLRIDGRDTGMMPLEMQVRRRDDAVQILQRREGRGPRGAERHARGLLEGRAPAHVTARGTLHLGRVLNLRCAERKCGADDAGGTGQQHATTGEL